MNRSVQAPVTRRIFLENLAQCGSVTDSAAAAGVNRQLLYAWRNQDPAFADAWEEALTLGINALEDHAMKMALAGSEKLVMFLLASRKPEVYGQRQSIDLNSHVTVNMRGQSLDDLRAELAQLLAPAPRLIDANADSSSTVVNLLGSG